MSSRRSDDVPKNPHPKGTMAHAQWDMNQSIRNLGSTVRKEAEAMRRGIERWYGGR